jgi:hypothetical protein
MKEKRKLEKKWVWREKTYTEATHDGCSLNRPAGQLQHTTHVVSFVVQAIIRLRDGVNGPAAHTCTMLGRLFTAQLAV